MKAVAIGSFVASLVTVHGANAQVSEAPPAPSRSAPAAHTGFQLALRTGYSLAMGKVAGGADESKMSDFVSGQVPLILDIGAKVIPNLFVGGYLGFGFGGVAGKQSDFCDALNADCISVGVRLGVEVQYHFLPADEINPWIGYGIGLESLAVGMKANEDEITQSASGFEFAHFMGGVDFRLSRVFGLGPFIDYSLGQYSSYKIEGDNIDDRDGDFDKKALHQWLTLGVRGVFFP